MSPERRHHTSKDTSFEIVVIPQGEARSTRSFKASVMKIILVCLGIVMLISSLTIVLIVYTPAGLLLPISEEQLRQRFGAELFDVQKRLVKVSSEVLVLREYNNKLRKVLGQKPLAPDSSLDYSNDTPPDQYSEEVDVPEPSNAETNSGSSSNKVVYKASLNEDQGVAFRASFPIIVPAVGYVSRKYEAELGHNGIDYAGKVGSLIVAAADGYIVFSAYTVDDGNMIIVSHGGGYLTVYKHNESNLKSVGDFVQRGEPIALLGNTGRTSYGPHLHFELWKDGKPQDPNEYLIASEL